MQYKVSGAYDLVSGTHKLLSDAHHKVSNAHETLTDCNWFSLQGSTKLQPSRVQNIDCTGFAYLPNMKLKAYAGGARAQRRP